MKLSDTNLLSLLPLFMRDDEANTALAKAIDKLISEPGSRIQQLRVWDKIDELDHGDLDELAWELNVDWYSTDMSLDAKRQTIKYAQQIQAKRGTKWAVEHLISAYFGRGYVREWFETGGDPFTFTVMTTNAEINEQNFSGFIKAVNAAKSARSHLDGVYYYKEIDTAIEALRATRLHLFRYPVCGAQPRTGTVGRVIRPGGINADAETRLFVFKYPKPGNKTGTHPRTAMVGAASNRKAEAGGTTSIHPYDYRMCGTHPKPGTLGFIQTPASAVADARASPYLFRHEKAGTKKAGTFPRFMMTGYAWSVRASAASSTALCHFQYTKCGTRRCGQN